MRHQGLIVGQIEARLSYATDANPVSHSRLAVLEETTAALRAAETQNAALEARVKKLEARPDDRGQDYSTFKDRLTKVEEKAKEQESALAKSDESVRNLRADLAASEKQTRSLAEAIRRAEGEFLRRRISLR
jgi:chromosome segregation ATPase